MMELILTSYRFRMDELLDEIKDIDDFKPTGFRYVVLGEVEDFHKFLAELNEKKAIRTQQNYSYREILHL